MKKELLVEKINNLPLFRLRDVAVKEEVLKENEEKGSFEEMGEDQYREIWNEKEHDKAITETTNTEPVAFVSDKYEVVQFKELFYPLVEKMGECEGDIAYHFGFAIMDVFPTDERFVIDGNRIGIVAYTSQDSSCALNIRFCVEHKGKRLTIPKKVAHFRKVHLGNISQLTQDYISMITEVKKAWTTIIEKFVNYEVTKDDLPNIAQGFKIDEHAMKSMRKKMINGTKYNLWDFCMEVFDYLSRKTYKSEVHRRKRLDKFVVAIFDYDLVMQI